MDARTQRKKQRKFNTSADSADLHNLALRKKRKGWVTLHYYLLNPSRAAKFRSPSSSVAKVV